MEEKEKEKEKMNYEDKKMKWLDNRLRDPKYFIIKKKPQKFYSKNGTVKEILIYYVSTTGV